MVDIDLREKFFCPTNINLTLTTGWPNYGFSFSFANFNVKMAWNWPILSLMCSPLCLHLINSYFQSKNSNAPMWKKAFYPHKNENWCFHVAHFRAWNGFCGHLYASNCMHGYKSMYGESSLLVQTFLTLQEFWQIFWSQRRFCNLGSTKLWWE